MFTSLECSHVGHLAIGGIFYHVRVIFADRDSQQLVVIRCLVLAGNAKPLAVWIELFGHCR